MIHEIQCILLMLLLTIVSEVYGNSREFWHPMVDRVVSIIGEITALFFVVYVIYIVVSI